MIEQAFALRKTLCCHSSDIRAVSALPNGGFVTGSRDKTSKVYAPNSNQELIEIQCFQGPEHYISSVCCLTPKGSEDSLIYVGSNDAIIYCYTLRESSPKCKLMDHSGTVCTLRADNENGLIASGSWDQTVRIWKDNKSLLVLLGHEAAIWSVHFINDFIVTASADKSIKIWEKTKGECIKTIKGHTDVVRDIAVINSYEFLTCSNDATVRKWNIDGQSLGVFYGHENFIYSISVLPTANNLEYATCSEDRTLRVWRNDECVQTIRLPPQTLWSVSYTTNGDIVVGCCNGTCYVYSRDPKLHASVDELQALEEEVAKSKVQMSDLGDIKVDELPGPETLLAPGKKDGQTKLVREGTNITVHQWDASKMLWSKIGDVVGAPGQTQDPSAKVTHEGKEYDYVFTVDIQDGVPPLKLPYNVTDDPWVTAQKFIHEHDLSQMFLDKIAHFIMQNVQGMVIDQRNHAGNADPFTSSSSYSSSQTKPTSNSNNVSKNSTPAVNSNDKFFPQVTYIKFEGANVEGIAKKLREFSSEVPQNVRLESDDIKLLLKLSDLSQEIQPEQIALIKLLISWPKSHIFPALDLIRIGVLLPTINKELTTSKDALRLLDTLLVCATDMNSSANQYLALRTLSNLFSHPEGANLNAIHAQTILKAVNMCTKSPVKQVQIALATLYLNYSVYFHNTNSSEDSLKFECLTSVFTLLNSDRPERECQFRCLVTLGTLAKIDADTVTYFKSPDVASTLKSLSLCGDAPKVAKCAEQIIAL